MILSPHHCPRHIGQLDVLWMFLSEEIVVVSIWSSLLFVIETTRLLTQTNLTYRDIYNHSKNSAYWDQQVRIKTWQVDLCVTCASCRICIRSFHEAWDAMRYCLLEVYSYSPVSAYSLKQTSALEQKIALAQTCSLACRTQHDSCPTSNALNPVRESRASIQWDTDHMAFSIPHSLLHSTDNLLGRCCSYTHLHTTGTLASQLESARDWHGLASLLALFSPFNIGMSSLTQKTF